MVQCNQCAGKLLLDESVMLVSKQSAMRHYSVTSYFSICQLPSFERRQHRWKNDQEKNHVYPTQRKNAALPISHTELIQKRNHSNFWNITTAKNDPWNKLHQGLEVQVILCEGDWWEIDISSQRLKVGLCHSRWLCTTEGQTQVSWYREKLAQETMLIA